jgi:hypothetical protein
MPILTDSEEGRKRQGKSSDGKMREVRDAMKAARNHGGTCYTKMNQQAP